MYLLLQNLASLDENMKLRGSYNQNEMNFTRKSNAKFILCSRDSFGVS